MSAKFQGLVDPWSGRVLVKIEASAVRPADAVDFRGMAVSPAGFIYAVLDTGQDRVFQSGLAIEANTGLLLLSTGPKANDAPGGLAVSSGGTVLYSDVEPDVIHQGVGLKNDGTLATDSSLKAIAFAGFGADADGKIRMLPRGAGSVTFTRDTAGSITDFQPLVQTGQVEEMRFDEARRVENIWPNPNGSEDFSTDYTAYTQATVAADGKTVTTIGTASWGYGADLTVTPGAEYTISIETSGGTASGVTNAVRDQTNEDFIFTDMQLSLGDRNARAFTVPAGCTSIRCYVFRLVTGTGTIIFKNAQLELGNKVSEYTSKGVLSGTPYHGVNVDGVAEFAYENGNSVDGNGVVTDAKGADLTTEWGALFEPAGTNYVTQSQALDTWTSTSVTVTADHDSAPDGRKTADRLQYAGGLGSPNTRIVETRDVVGGGTAGKTFTGSVWLKSNTGSDQAARVKVNHWGVLATFSSDLVITPTWQRFQLRVDNGASAGTGEMGLAVTAATTDAAFDVVAWQGQTEDVLMSSEIPTSGTAVTRTIDDGSEMFDLEGNFDQSKGSLVVDLRWTSNYDDISEEVEELIAVSQLTRGLLFYCSNPATIPIGLYSYDQTNLCKIDLPFVANKTYRIGLTWSVANGINLSWKNITDSGSWQIWANTPFDGLYTTVGTSIRVARPDDLYRPVLFRDLRIWQQDLGTDFIEGNY